jgi:hypothetical protein
MHQCTVLQRVALVPVCTAASRMQDFEQNAHTRARVRVRPSVCEWVRARMCVCVHACVRASVRARARVCVVVRASESMIE